MLEGGMLLQRTPSHPTTPDMDNRFSRKLIVGVVIVFTNTSCAVTSLNKWISCDTRSWDPPSSPTISGYEKGKPIKAGDLQKLTCVSTGGNPPANLKWFKNDKEFAGTQPPPPPNSSESPTDAHPSHSSVNPGQSWGQTKSDQDTEEDVEGGLAEN
ncbi:nephrin [Caerostris extrusa]|uniref:Nephrin n=1 Tax=Caerostris extrusa TaxID=172846 RepID=A0AAV4TJZ7_CAEEX|nr:nephrin [Caerostris extrusa]